MPSTTGSRPYTRTLRQDIMSAKERRMNKAKYPQVKYNELTMISYKIDEINSAAKEILSLYNSSKPSLYFILLAALRLFFIID